MLVMPRTEELRSNGPLKHTARCFFFKRDDIRTHAAAHPAERSCRLSWWSRNLPCCVHEAFCISQCERCACHNLRTQRHAVSSPLQPSVNSGTELGVEGSRKRFSAELGPTSASSIVSYLRSIPLRRDVMPPRPSRRAPSSHQSACRRTNRLCSNAPIGVHPSPCQRSQVNPPSRIAYAHRPFSACENLPW
jgi:hypothetical protein